MVKEKENHSILITMMFVCVMTGILMVNHDKVFVGVTPADLTGNQAMDEHIIRNAGEINFTIMLFLSICFAGITNWFYKLSRFIECKIEQGYNNLRKMFNGTEEQN